MTGYVGKSAEIMQVSDFSHEYCELLISPTQLDLCRRAESVAAFLAQLKILWQATELSDDSLLAKLSQLNQQPLDIDANALATSWLPYGYDAKRQTILWCLPDGPATEPFQDQTISRYRQQLINQILKPKSTLASALASSLPMKRVQLSGFIFHLSRCGSTLVSGSCAELKSVSVFSESPVLTECLLDSRLSPEEQRQLLIKLIIWQSRAVAPFVVGQQQLVIKWNAWDIFHWPLIRALFPLVPVIFLIRNPVEIVASHQKSAGRHMAGDPSMALFDKLFSLGEGENILAMRIRVLDNLLAAMRQYCEEPGVAIVDYKQLSPATMTQVMNIFALAPTAREQEAIMRRMGFNAKELEQVFSSDSQRKQDIFNADEREQILASTNSIYQSLVTLSLNLE